MGCEILACAILLAMDELVISDKRYISTRRAGKEHGYHSDYIGQLIRGGKVQGQKVGRSWYVDEESLAQYLGKEYDKSVSSALVAEAQPRQEAPAEILPAVEEIKTQAQQEEEIPLEIKKVEEPPAKIEAQTEEVLIPVRKLEPLEPEPKAVEPEKIKQIEEPVPITRIMPRAPQTNRTGGLRYIPDDEPLLPEIEPAANESRVEEPAEKSQKKLSTPSVRSHAPVLAMIALASIGAAAMALSAAASALVASRVSIAGQEASTSYSIGQ